MTIMEVRNAADLLDEVDRLRATRLVDTVTIPMLFKTVGSHRIDPKLLITHRFKLDRILDAYETFGNAAKTKALKVIIEA
jgi:alcohol dehydrogenase